MKCKNCYYWSSPGGTSWGECSNAEVLDSVVVDGNGQFNTLSTFGFFGCAYFREKEK